MISLRPGKPHSSILIAEMPDAVHLNSQFWIPRQGLVRHIAHRYHTLYSVNCVTMGCCHRRPRLISSYCKAEPSMEASPENVLMETVDSSRLSWLRRQALSIKQEIKLGRRGVSRGVVDQIKNRWRTAEIVKVRCHGRPATNMKSLASELETSSGGIIIQRTGGVIYLWRGETCEGT